MKKITIIAIGKVKEKYFQAACSEYLKRLSPYAKVSVAELAAESFGPSSRDKAKEKEGERIAAAISKYKEAEIFILDEHGDNPDSVSFSKLIDKTDKHIIFVVGGSLGFSRKILDAGYENISLSAMTMPHELSRVVLLEQIYRAITIAKKKEYHY